MTLTISNLTKFYGDRLVLRDVSLTLSSGQRIGLVGANGVGKSTLLAIIAGEVPADGGTITLAPGAYVGWLPQTLYAAPGCTLDTLLDGAFAGLRALHTRMRELEARMATATSELTAIMDEYGDVLARFEQQGGWDIEQRKAQVFTGLGIDHLPRTRRIATLSGGERARVGLALLLLQASDVLLLDEPTNHLDHAALVWLEAYLAAAPQAMLIVSHDREFLNRTVNAIVELDEHTHAARCYPGDYDAYQRAKAVERRRWEADYVRQQDEIKAITLEMNTTARRVGYHRQGDGDKFLRFHRKTVVERTVSRRLSSAEERLRRIQADPVPKPPEPLRFRPEFDPGALRSHWPLAVSGLRKQYGNCRVLDGVTFTLDTRSRILIVGPNGAGKSTLLRILAGLETPDDGDVMVNPQVRIGWLDQSPGMFAPETPVLDVYAEGMPGTTQQHVSDLLAAGLFRYEELRQRVGELSCGQQRKLQLARLIGQRANLLLLDEPTNFVSFDVLEAFEAALRDFSGPVIAVSHDRRFIARFGGDVWTLRNGRLVVEQMTAAV